MMMATTSRKTAEVSDLVVDVALWPDELLVAVRCKAQSDAYVTTRQIPFNYVWHGQRRAWWIPAGFRFAPSTTFFSRLAHDPREGPHIVASLFHDYLFELVDVVDVTIEEANAVHAFVLAVLKDDDLDRFVARAGLALGSRIWRKMGAWLRRCARRFSGHPTGQEGV